MSTTPYRLAAAFGLTLAIARCAASQDYGKVELLRDNWGIPHVFSDTDAGAMCGLGHATAHERGFQMTYGLRIMQGRLAEIVGARQKGGRRETAFDNDRRMRTSGWAHAASRIASNLDPVTLGLLTIPRPLSILDEAIQGGTALAYSTKQLIRASHVTKRRK